MSIDDNCKGCRLSIVMIMRCDLNNQYTEKEQTFKCPCIKCIVKGMCSKYCNDYFDYVGGYFEYVKSHPLEFIQRYHPWWRKHNDTNHTYTLKSYRGVPITVKYNSDGEKVEIGPDIDLLRVWF